MPDTPEQWGDGCECWVTPESMWFHYGSAIEPGSQVEWNPECPKHPPRDTEPTCVHCQHSVEQHDDRQGCYTCGCTHVLFVEPEQACDE
jgi:hypothetical protein